MTPIVRGMVKVNLMGDRSATVNPTAGAMQADMERVAKHVFRQLPPGLNVSDALAEPDHGVRNLTLRKALGLEFPGRRGELCKVDLSGTMVQVVQRNLTAARRVERILTEQLEPLGWQIILLEQGKGEGWLVQANGPLDDEDEALALHEASLLPRGDGIPR